MSREQDLKRIAKQLDKMVTRNNTEGALDLLKELQNFNMTLKLLQETRIGMSVNGIRKHCSNEEVVSLAKILIKNWKRLLESGQVQNMELCSEFKNGSDSMKQTQSSSEQSPDSSPKYLLNTHKKLTDKDRKEKGEALIKNGKQDCNQKKVKHFSDHIKVSERSCGTDSDALSPLLTPPSICPSAKVKKERKELDLSQRPPPAHIRIPKNQPEIKKDRSEGQEMLNSPPSQHSYPHHSSPPPKRSSIEASKERKELDLSQRPTPAHIRIPKNQPEIKKDRIEGQEMLSSPPSQHSHPHHSSPPPKRPSLDSSKERKPSVDLDAPSPPPHSLHLHSPTLTKRLSLEMPKDKDRKDTPASKQHAELQTSQHKKDRHLEDNKPPKKHAGEMKKERKESTDSKQEPIKKSSHDGKRGRNDSTDSRSIQVQPSSDIKAQRRDSVNSKSHSSPPSKKLTGERRDSSKLSVPGVLQRKMSTDSNDSRKSKPETPKTPTTPTTPTTPQSPSFSSASGSLSPHLLTGDSVRDKCIEMLSAALRTDDDYKDYGVNCDAMAAEIEDYVYQEIKATDMKYKNRVRSRISNLKDPKNPNLRKNVLGGAIELSHIATMTAEEMASDELKQLRNVLTQEAIREHQMAKTGGTVTDLLQCPKCRKKNCTYNQVQTRSADEPMTTFVLCNECGNRWKFC